MPHLGRDQLRAYLEERGERVASEGDLLVLEVPWNESKRGRIELRTDELRVTVWLPLPIEVGAGRHDDLAAALSAANRELRMVGFRLLGDQLVFSLAAFLDEDRRVSSAVVDRLLAIARLASRAHLEKLTAAAQGARPRRRPGSTMVERAVELPAAARDELGAAVARDLPELAPLAAAARDTVEVLQPFFPGRRILEVRLDARRALQVSEARGGELAVLTTHLETLNRIAAEELADAELDDDAAQAYLLAGSHWARPLVDDRRIDQLEGDARVHPPRPGMNVAGHQVTFWVLSGERLVRRTAVLHIFDMHLELIDEAV